MKFPACIVSGSKVIKEMQSYIYYSQVGCTLSISQQQSSTNIGHHIHGNEHYSSQAWNIVASTTTKETGNGVLIAEREINTLNDDTF